MSNLGLNICLALSVSAVTQAAFAQDHSGSRRRGVDPYEEEAHPRSGSSELFAKSPSPFSNLIDQNDFDTKGTKLLRATKLSAGIAYGTGSLRSTFKRESSKDKATATVTPMELFAVYPTPIGLRVGVNYVQLESKTKVSYEFSGDRSRKYSSDVIAITAAAATPSGFGGALILSTNKESNTLEATPYNRKIDDDANYGVILPQFYYADEALEAIFIWKPSQRHETGTNVGVYELKLEYGLSEIHPMVDITRYRNSENDGDKESDHFKLEGGIRYILDRESNIRVLANVEEAYYTGRESATNANGASWGLSLAGEHVVQASHVLGYSVSYQQWNAKGKTLSVVSPQSTTISADMTGLLFSYKYVMR